MSKTKYCKKNDIEQCLARRVLCICNVILQHPLFAGIAREETHKLSAIADVIYKEKGEHIFHKGTKADKVYFILEGSAKVYAYDKNSGREFIHSLLERSAAIGLDQVFIDFLFYDYSVQCLEKSTVLLLNREEFKKIISRSSVISENLLKFLSADAMAAREQIEQMALKELDDRVIAYLSELSYLSNSLTAELPLSKADTAALLGTVPESFSRVLQRLKKSGVISTINKNQITLACN